MSDETKVPCVDCKRPDVSTRDDWEFYEDITLCYECVGKRARGKSRPQEWYIDRE